MALVGLATSLGITRVPAANPAKKFRANFLADLWAQMRVMRRDRPLLLAVTGNTYFNFLGALLLLNLFFYGADVLHVDETKIGLLNVALALGIGLGSVAAGYLSGGKIEYGLVPLGAFGLAALLRLAGRARSVRERRARAAGAAGLFGRLFHRAHLRAAATPARPDGERGDARGGEPAFVRRHLSRVRRALGHGARAVTVARRQFFSLAAW